MEAKPLKNQFWGVIAKALIILGLIFVLTSFFVLSARAATVTLQWDANDPEPDGYRLFMRTEGNAYNFNTPVWTGQDTTCNIDGLLPATQYYFVVRAYVKDDESGDSNEVEYKPDISPPANLRIKIEISVYIDVNGVPYVAQTQTVDQ